MKQPKKLKDVCRYKFKSKEDFNKFINAKNGVQNTQIANYITNNDFSKWDVEFGLKRINQSCYRLCVDGVFVPWVITPYLFTQFTIQFLEPLDEGKIVDGPTKHKVYSANLYTPGKAVFLDKKGVKKMIKTLEARFKDPSIEIPELGYTEEKDFISAYEFLKETLVKM